MLLLLLLWAVIVSVTEALVLRSDTRRPRAHHSQYNKMFSDHDQTRPSVNSHESAKSCPVGWTIKAVYCPQCALKLSECAWWSTQCRWKVIPDTGSRDCKTAWSIGYRSRSNRSPCVAEQRLQRPVPAATGVRISAR